MSLLNSTVDTRSRIPCLRWRFARRCREPRDTDLRRPRSSTSIASFESPATLKDLWRRGRRGWPASFPVAQIPNAPLTVALGGWATAELTAGAAHSYARAVFVAGLSAWAWGEVTS